MKFIYLFDPLCGWCYAAAPVVAELAETAEVRPFATGLFADPARKMDEAFARHAWANDQRIAEMTGRPFSETYRRNLLQSGAAFDSTALTEALYAVWQQQPDGFFKALSTLQKARYTEGRDTSDPAVVRAVLAQNGIGLPENLPDAREWTAQGQAFARQSGIRGVPALLAETGKGRLNVPSSLLYRDAENAAENIKTWLDAA